VAGCDSVDISGSIQWCVSDSGPQFNLLQVNTLGGTSPFPGYFRPLFGPISGYPRYLAKVHLAN
jgi:hypothetical protein